MKKQTEKELMLIVATDNGYRAGNILYCEESLYKDKQGRWFLGKFSPSWIAMGDSMNEEIIQRISKVKAKSWLVQRGLKHKIKRLFPKC